ncbi:MAG TPA: hypothetical protein VK666_16620 [Chryseolinea sp.]|nr:hypothetical protein [Chryseolinea sp.]
MRISLFIITGLVMLCSTTKAQTIENPSFEGPPAPGLTPTGWFACNDFSTPDTQPGSWGVSTPAQNDNTYISLVTRGDGTVEAIGTSFSEPISTKACYAASFHLAFSPDFNYEGIPYYPIKLAVYVSTQGCVKSQLVWTSPVISHSDWREYGFTFTPNTAYTDLILEAQFTDAVPLNGHVLVDNFLNNQ